MIMYEAAPDEQEDALLARIERLRQQQIIADNPPATLHAGQAEDAVKILGMGFVDKLVRYMRNPANHKLSEGQQKIFVAETIVGALGPWIRRYYTLARELDDYKEENRIDTDQGEKRCPMPTNRNTKVGG